MRRFALPLLMTLSALGCAHAPAESAAGPDGGSAGASTAANPPNALLPTARPPFEPLPGPPPYQEPAIRSLSPSSLSRPP